MSIEILLLKRLISETLQLNESESYKKLKIIRSQSIKRSLSWKNQQGKLEFKTCSICLQKYQQSFFPRAYACEHNPFCYNCSQDLIKIKIIDRTLITCEIKGCDAQLDTSTKLFQSIDESLKMIFNDTSRLLIHKQFNCRQANCSGYFQEESLACDTCKTSHCAKCLERQHENDCFLNNLLQNSHVKTCPNCKIMISKDQGCNHIVCPCKFEFCYVCTGEWSKMHHLCTFKQSCRRFMKCTFCTLLVLLILTGIALLIVFLLKRN